MTRLAIPILLFLPALLGQDERPRFEVASIRAYPEGSPFQAAGTLMNSGSNGLSVRFFRLSHVLAWAYGIPGQVLGPAWIHNRYDINAKAAGPVSADQLKLMTQTLIEDRFALKVHRESRDLPVAVLVLAKGGPKNLEPVQTSDSAHYESDKGRLVATNVSMEQLALFLGNSPPYGVREQVVDQTNLKGIFAIDLNVEGFDPKDEAFAFLSEALEKKYGLKLEHRKIPLECLVVDSGSKIPTEN